MELGYLISAHRLAILYICIKFQENISKGSRVTERMRFVYCNLQKGHNSAKSVVGVKVTVQYISSDNALYLYQVLQKYLIGFQSYGPRQ